MLGFLVSLSGGGFGGGFGSSFGSSFSTGSSSDGRSGMNPLPGWWGNSQMRREIGRWLADNSETILAAIGVLLCVLFVLWIVLLLLGEIGQGGLITNVDGIERSGSPGLGDGWRAGAARMRTLVGMRLLLAIPGLLLVLIALALFAPTIAALISGVRSAGDITDNAALALGSGMIGMICAGIPLLCVVAIYNLLIGLLETFSRRAIMLENLGTFDSIKRGWAVFRSRIGDSIVIAILMAVVNFIVGIIIALPLVVVIGVSTAAVMMSDGTTDNISWSLVAVAVAVLLFILMTAVIGSYLTAANSAAWTLAYRTFTTAVATTTEGQSGE
ncbi:MAG: hypothetical protein NTZ50_03590 [Chloroflexi bacterium]|nr:hypothetical protein [Chloroflexota bacterium]